MNKSVAFAFIITVVYLFPIAVSLRCLSCFSKANSRCKEDPDYFSQDCPDTAEGCFTTMTNYGDYSRGCADMSVKLWRDFCRNRTEMGCTFCKTDDCNDLLFENPKRQQCVLCTGEVCLNKTDLEPCDQVIHSNPQYCYYYMLDRAVVQKGCGTRPPFKPADKSILTVCIGNGCNMELPNTYSACYKYEGPYDKFYTRTLRLCHSDSPWHPGCYFMGPWTNRNNITTSGCLSHLEPATARKCTTNEYRFHCQYCLGDECNQISPTNYNFTNRCQAPPNAEHFCSGLDIRCFVSWLRVPASHTHKNTTWIIQMNGGCVEPGLNPFLLVAPQTHFCDNLNSPEQPCMQINTDFSKRISCYRCRDCENVFEMDHRIKHICPEGVTQCYQVMGRDLRVRRGCVHPLDDFIGVCSAYDFTCAKCDYNYCNYNTVRNNTVGRQHGQCYKTRPFQHRSNLLTMRLEECMGQGFTKLWPDCYVATTSTRIIEAGCVNEARAEDIVRWNTMTLGDISIINADIMSCYKCVSNQTGFCYNVRHLEPEACRGQRQYAIRGCYTLFQRNSIQRGCLTELDLYTQKLCVSTTNFEDACVICTESFCNIHVP